MQTNIQSRQGKKRDERGPKKDRRKRGGGVGKQGKEHRQQAWSEPRACSVHSTQKRCMHAHHKETQTRVATKRPLPSSTLGRNAGCCCCCCCCYPDILHSLKESNVHVWLLACTVCLPWLGRWSRRVEHTKIRKSIWRRRREEGDGASEGKQGQKMR